MANFNAEESILLYLFILHFHNATFPAVVYKIKGQHNTGHKIEER